jgi:hypothetical protein
MRVGIDRRATIILTILCGVGIALMNYSGHALAQAAKYDGVYAGSQTLTDHSVDNNYAQCLRGPFKRRLIVKDGVAVYTYNPTYQGQVTGTVSTDGDVSGSTSEPTGGVALSGKIQGDDFTGEVWSMYCTYALQLKRVP